MPACALTLAFLLSWVSLESVEGLGLEPRNPVSQVGVPVSPLCLAGHVGVWWAGEVWGKGAQEESRGLPILRRRDGPCRMLWAVPTPRGLCCDIVAAPSELRIVSEGPANLKPFGGIARAGPRLPPGPGSQEGFTGTWLSLGPADPSAT